MKVTVNFKSLKKFDKDAVGCYITDTAKKGNAIVEIDIDKLLALSKDKYFKKTGFKKLFTETVLHEILHSIEDLYDKSFNHKRINNAINRAFKKCNKKRKFPLKSGHARSDIFVQLHK